MTLPLLLLGLAQDVDPGKVPAPETVLAPQLKRFVDVFNAIDANAAEAVIPNQAIYGGALTGMLRTLDPHSIFFDADQFQQLQEMQRAEQKGFGTIVSVLPGRVFVLQALPGTPSARSGLSPGDEIVAVNNVPLATLVVEQIIGLLGEARRQQAKIDVRRPNSPRTLSFILTPESIASPSVDRAFVIQEPGIAFIRVSGFETKTGAELRAAIEKLGGRDLKGLVLDLRNNPGGVVEAALEVSSMFLKPGDTIMSVRGRTKKEQDVQVPATAQPWEVPVVILINNRTASSAEIVAGALQDHKRATILGERSFGKGLVQSVYPLSAGNGIALTVAFYHTPSGRNIQRPLTDVQLHTEGGVGGIEPDVLAAPEMRTRLRSVIDGSGVLTAFATEYIRTHPALRWPFVLEPRVVDDLKVFLSQRNIQPSVSEWSGELGWVSSRLKQEILNLAVSVEKGDEVEFARDPQVTQAIQTLLRSSDSRKIL